MVAIISDVPHACENFSALQSRWRRKAKSSQLVLTRVSKSGQVAQVVERSPEKAGVGGSTPSLATIFSITYNQLGRLGVAPKGNSY